MLVLKGGLADTRRGACLSDSSLNGPEACRTTPLSAGPPPDATRFSTASASAPLLSSLPLPSSFLNSASKDCPAASNCATMRQYSSGTKARISRSRSTTSLTATLCTRPADSPRVSFFQSSSESW